MTALPSIPRRRADSALHPIHIAERRIAEIRHQGLQALLALSAILATAPVAALILLVTR